MYNFFFIIVDILSCDLSNITFMHVGLLLTLLLLVLITTCDIGKYIGNINSLQMNINNGVEKKLIVIG